MIIVWTVCGISSWGWWAVRRYGVGLAMWKFIRDQYSRRIADEIALA
jgi:hypothetical protein